MAVERAASAPAARRGSAASRRARRRPTSRTLRRYSSTVALAASPAPVGAEPPRPSGGNWSAGWRRPGHRPRRRRCGRGGRRAVQPGARQRAGRRGRAASARPSNSDVGVDVDAERRRARRGPAGSGGRRARRWRRRRPARWGRSPRILPTSWVSTRPGPASTNTRAPAAYMASIWSTKRTGLATCSASRRRGRRRGRSGRARRWCWTHTGIGGAADRDAGEARGERSPARGDAAGCGTRRPRGAAWRAMPAALERRRRAPSTAAVGPGDHDLVGALWLASTTSGWRSRQRRPARRRRGRPRPWCRGRRRGRRPRRGWPRRGPRSARAASAASSAPAAASATSSP